MVNSPYHLIPLGLLLSILYLLSYGLSRSGLFSKTTHRRIWNIILLTVFISTASLGMLLAIQINYKLEWPIVKALLKWHVDLGICLSFVAAFHFTWHWKYYMKIVHAGKQVSKPVIAPDIGIMTKERLVPLIFLSGFSATIIQVLMVREITVVFQGNELMMGWTLGAWMLLTGIGALLGRNRFREADAVRKTEKILLLTGLLPIIIMGGLNLSKNILFPPGIMIDPIIFLLILLLVLSPVCLLSGFLYSFFIGQISLDEKDFIKVYAWEAIGSMIGGVMVSYIFIYLFSILQSFLLNMAIIAVFIFFRYRKLKNSLPVLISLCFFAIAMLVPADLWLKSLLYISQDIKESRETIYGNITITETAGQYSIYENGSLSFMTDNIVASEEFVHYAMLQRDTPENILLIGGGVSGMLAEILKYPSVKQLEYVELNPRLVGMVSQYIAIPEDKRITIIPRDPRRYVQHTGNMYDIVIMAMPEPSSLQINRFFTADFLKILKKKLKDNAVVLFSHPASGNYLSANMLRLEGIMYRTIKSQFHFVEVIPGEKDYFIGSDSAISINIAGLTQTRNIENMFVNPSYIDDESLLRRSWLILQKLEGIVLPLNTDTRPLPVFYHSLLFLSIYGRNVLYFIIIPLLMLFVPVFYMKPVSFGVYSAGFTASSIELLIIFSFQVFFGFVYSLLGLIIAIFMGGLAAGSAWSSRYQVQRKYFVYVQVLLFISCILFASAIKFSEIITDGLAGITFFLLITVVVSFLVGFQYAMGARLCTGNPNQSPSVLYGIDLLGSALGVIAITIFILPVLGFEKSCLVVAGINLTAALVNHIKSP